MIAARHRRWANEIPRRQERRVSRVAIVTGGASGIGLATVRRLEGLDVAVTSFDLQGTSSVDVADERAVAEAIGEVRRRHGPIDILVNCAGIGAGGPARLGQLR